MKKIPTLFARNPDNRALVTEEVTPGCEWVLAGEGHPTRKLDGSACLVQDGKLYKRYDAKNGKIPPSDFLPAQEEADPVTGHWPGWVPVGDGPEDQYHREAWDRWTWKVLIATPLDGTYELIGPKVQGGAERSSPNHQLLRHGACPTIGWANPRTFGDIQAYLAKVPMEGIVWHHPDGRMCKIKRCDFGLEWPVKE